MAVVTDLGSWPVTKLQVEEWVMTKAEMIIGCSDGSQRTESATTKSDYRTPKLTVVGTVHDLTLGRGNRGAADGPVFLTAGAG